MTSVPIELPGPDATIDVNEIFGPVFQGEGPSTGRRCGFVRLARCNLDCGEGAGATWCCDTPYTWRWDGQFDDRRSTFDPAKEIHQRTVGSVAAEISRMDVPLCVITGGEPLSQRGKVGALARALHPWVGCEVETNGTVNPGPAATHVEAFNVSPKLANSGVAFEKRYKPAVLRNLTHTGKARFKFVCSSVADLDEVDWVVSDAELPAGSVWVMPAGTDAATIAARLEALADAVVRRGYNLSGRLHVTVYGDRRGV